MKAEALPRFRGGRWIPGLPQVVIVLLVLGLFVALAIQPTRQLLEQKDRISGMSHDLNRLERSNTRLERRIERLKDPDYIEQRARTQIGLVRPGETAVIVMPPGESKRNENHKDAHPRPSHPRDTGFLAAFVRFLGLP
jgi:cell division protein DivIC